MSGKGRVRRTRRTNTNDEESDLKQEELIDQSDDNQSTISNDTDKTASITKDETNGLDSPPKINTEDLKPKEINKTATEKTSSPAKPEADAEKIEKDTEKTTNGQPDIAPTKNGDDQSSEEMEPLNVDSEDPELQFTSEQNSDKSSEVDLSPILTRCKTRRSHTRNLPTPKTPKILDFNGDSEEKLSEKSEKLSVISEKLSVISEKSPGKSGNKSPEKMTPKLDIPEVIITIPDDSEPEEYLEDVSITSNVSIAGSSADDKTLESDLTNASVFVNIGNDTTKNFDITVPINLEEDMSDSPNFLEASKNKSYGETLRCLTGRKATRHSAFKTRMYNSSMELRSKDSIDSSRKYVPTVGVKRKLEGGSPDQRSRTEDVDSPGILSYLTSPFKSKIARTEIPGSTPKLTSFKFTRHGSTVIDEVSKTGFDIDGKPTTDPKKWCSIM